MTSVPLEDRLGILRAETTSLEQFLSALLPEDWDRPSACDKWTVADVVAHLTSHSKQYPSRISRALVGDASADAPAIPRRGSGEVDATGVAQRAIELRNELSQDLLAEFIKANRGMDEALARIGPRDWDRLVYRSVGPESLRNIVDIFIAEWTVHGWDIRSRFEPQARLSPGGVCVTVERIPQRPRWWSFAMDGHPGPLPLRYRFEVAPPLPHGMDVVIARDRQYMEMAGQGQADVTFRCDGETFVLLMYGRVRPATAVAENRLLYEGDARLANDFIDRFTGG